MAIYTVHVPSDGEDAIDRADRTAFVRDGFSFWAFLLGPLYLLRFRAFTAAVGWVIVVGAIVGFCRLLRLPLAVDAALLLLVALFTGLEASTVRRLTLHWRGFDLVEVVDGASREAGERRFFQGATLEGLPPRRTVAGGSAARPGEPVIGFFPDAEIRR